MVGKRAPLAERFWAKVKRGAPGKCWEWTAKKNNMGYGRIGVRKEAGHSFMLAHRLSYELEYGPFEADAWVLHKCDNPGCVNPEHLFLGNQSDNVRDMHSKARGRSTIGPTEALEIRRLGQDGMPRRAIAKKLGVTMHIVKEVLTKNRTWAWLK